MTMVSYRDQKLPYNIKLSSIGPGRATECDVVYEPSGMDLAMKLHYVKGVYFFNSEASLGLSIMRIKESMFYWLNEYYIICGRIRRSDAGRPYIKCNDCGARFVEAQCDQTIQEWLEMRDCSLNNSLVYHLPLGPELTFSPPIYVQVTEFKCGGLSVGLSWAHILGDAFSASDCFHTWSQFLAGLRSNEPFKTMKASTIKIPENLAKHPLSVKRVDPVGDHWVSPNTCKMETFSLHLTASQLSNLHSKVWGGQKGNENSPIFESLCAIIWQCIAKVRNGREPKTVTLCKKDLNNPKNGILCNNQIISSIEANFSVVDSDVKRLALLLVDQVFDEKAWIEELVEKDNGVLDYILYGANLTFVNLDEANLYGLECNGHKPEFVYYTIQGVGDEGAIFMQPCKNSIEDGNVGRVVTIILPENEMEKLQAELKKYGLLVENEVE